MKKENSDIDISIDEAVDKAFKNIDPILQASYKYHIQKEIYNSNEKNIKDNIVKSVNESVKELRNLLNGVPNLLILGKDQKKPVYDTYVDSMINELLFALRKSYKNVNQVILYNRLEFWARYYEDEELASLVGDIYQEEYWNNLEMAYIRLASVWDRIGRLLDFVFFNIRQYDREGYLATVQKIHVNLVPMSSKLKESSSWVNLWGYSKKESANGLKWLLNRRNLIVHQISLQELDDFDVEDNEFYLSKHNHILDNTVKKKLKPKSKNEEEEQVIEHLETTFLMFEDIKNLCELGLDIIPRVND